MGSTRKNVSTEGVKQDRQEAPLGHHCHARGCTTAVAPEMLMCARHWRRVPHIVQRAVWKAYRPGQCDDMNPSKAWHVAADAAIGHVAKLEGLKLRDVEARAMLQFELLKVAGTGTPDPKPLKRRARAT